MSSPTAQWLRRAVAGERPQCAPGLIEDLPGLDAIALARLAMEHGVAPWALAALDGRGDAERLAPLRALAVADTARSMGALRAMHEVVPQLRARGIDAIVLKGPHIAYGIYPAPQLRPYRDLDLLLHACDLERAGAMLEADGYHATGEHAGHGHGHEGHAEGERGFFHRERLSRVELHGDHLQLGLAPASADDLWSRATEIRVGGERVPVLDEHDLFVHLCVHLHRHGFSRLIWFKDLELLATSGRLDWTRVAERAESDGVLGSVTLSLALVEALIGRSLGAGPAWLRGREHIGDALARRFIWRPESVLALEHPDRNRLRRMIQFAPEEGLLRGALPSLLFAGRRASKLRVLLGGLARRQPRIGEVPRAPAGTDRT